MKGPQTHETSIRLIRTEFNGSCQFAKLTEARTANQAEPGHFLWAVPRLTSSSPTVSHFQS